MTTKTDTRSIEIDLPIDASPEDVWKALTDPVELTRWFPMDAWVEPGDGGAIEVAWGKEMQGRHPIQRWEPGKHLRTGWFEPTERFGATGPQPEGSWDELVQEDRESAERLVVDYHLEGRSGGTTLRLVHSGFSRDAKWDYEFEGHSRGWSFELLSLKNYLEHHPGKERYLAWVRHPVPGTQEEAWAKLTGAEGLAREGSLDGKGPGDRYAITTVHGDRLEGQVRHHEPPHEFAATVENFDHSLMRAGIDRYTGPLQASFWLSVWGDPSRAQTFRDHWTTTLNSLFA